MSRIVHLVRHGTHAEVGRVLSGRSEIDLNAEGAMQADAVGALLEGVPVATIHSSPRRRAWRTAAPLAAARGLEVRLADALDEIDFGAFAGRSFGALDGDAEWHRWNAERVAARCPGGETMAEAVGRARAYLFALDAAATPAVCFTHCDIIRGLVAATLEVGFDRIHAMACDPGSCTTLAIDAGRLVTINAQVRR